MTTQSKSQSKSQSQTTGRTAEFEFEIDAPVADVWAAITQADHLMRWFPPEARVENPGQGGSMWMKWGEMFEGECSIDVWEPEKHLRTTFMEPPAEDREPMRTYVDYHLESKGGKTVLRLVHSGFGKGEHWDRLYDGVSRGWAAELRSLRHYIENHFGKDRRFVWCLAPYDRDDAQVWASLMGPEGLGLENADTLKPGDRFRATGPALGEITGTVLLHEAPGVFVGISDDHGGAYLRVELERCSGPTPSVWIWFAAWGAPGERIDELSSSAEKAVQSAVN